MTASIVSNRTDMRAGSTKPAFAFVAAIAVACGFFIAEISIGSVAIPVHEIIQILLTGASDSRVSTNIVWEFRLPRAINAICSGAALGIAGVMLQTLFRNPLADPYILGVVHGARLGAAVLVVSTGLAGNALLVRFGLVGDIGLALASVLGCLVILMILSYLSERVSIVVLLLAGLMLGYFALGLINLFCISSMKTTSRPSRRGTTRASRARPGRNSAS